MTTRTVALWGLAATAASFYVQMAGGVSFPVIPPGLAITVVVGVTVSAVHRRWAFVFGAAWSIFLLVGSVASGSTARLGHPGVNGNFFGLVLELASTAVTLVASIAALATFAGDRDSRRSNEVMA